MHPKLQSNNLSRSVSLCNPVGNSILHFPGKIQIRTSNHMVWSAIMDQFLSKVLKFLGGNNGKL